MKIGKRIFATLLAAMLILTGIPLTGFVGLGEELLPIASAVTSGDYAYEVLEDGTAEITVYDGDGGDVIIPDTLDGYTVTTIGDFAFAHCDALTTVSIGNSVTTIGDGAFSWCVALTTVELGDSVTTIGDDAFHSCDALTAITVAAENPNYSSDEDGVLYNKDKTALIQYPIGSSRTAYTIPDSVTTIGDEAFQYCDALTTVEIPDSVTTIGDSAFDRCRALTTVEIGDSVTTIGYRAFYNCDALTTVYYTGTEEHWDAIDIGSYNDPLLEAELIFGDMPDGSCAEGHTEEIIPGKAATCTATGLTEGKKCSVCGEILQAQEVIPARGHTEEVLPGKAATCTEAGLTEGKKCSVCGEILQVQEEIPALGHEFGEWMQTTAPSYLSEGMETATCSRCGEVQTRTIEKLIPTQTKADESTGIEIGIQDETYDGDMVVTVEQQFDGTSFQILNNEKGNFKNELFDITTTVNGEKVQPNGMVLVKIPIPADYNPERTAVYYVANDGSGIHKLDSYIENGKICFETDHFSAYALVDESEEVSTEPTTEPSTEPTTEPPVTEPAEPEYVLGDVNGDGRITSADARLALRAAVNLETLTEIQRLAADVDKDNNVRSADARMILRAAVGLESLSDKED